MQSHLACFQIPRTACREGLFQEGKLGLKGQFASGPTTRDLQDTLGGRKVAASSEKRPILGFQVSRPGPCPPVPAAFGCTAVLACPSLCPLPSGCGPGRVLPTVLVLRKLSALRRPECCAQPGCNLSGRHVSSPHKCSSPPPL